MSDQELTRCSGLIKPGDVILADRGFLIADDVTIRGAKLVIPAFPKGKQQLSKRGVYFITTDGTCPHSCMWNKS